MVSNIKLVYITTIPVTLGFFRGHISYLKSRAVDIHVVSSPGVGLEQFGADLGVPVHPVPMTRSISPIKDLHSAWRLWRVLSDLKPHVLHAVSPKAGLLGTMVARLVGVPIVVSSVFGLPQMTKSGLLRRLLNITTRISSRCSDRVWCDSFSMRDYVANAGLCASDKLIVLGQGSVNGVDAEGRFSPFYFGKESRNTIRQRYNIPGDARVIGFVGRIVADKGMHELASAWRVLREKYADIHLLLVGPLEDGDPLRQDDQLLFQTDPRIHLAGRQHDIPPYLSAMDISVMPSYREGFGVTNIEASAMALPIVSTLIPGCVDSVQDGVTGMLVPPRDAKALAMVVAEYLDNPELLRKHGLAGRERVLQDFRPEIIQRALYQEYTNLCQEKEIIVPVRDQSFHSTSRKKRHAA
jgi:glycosyltransferase involved in cell wall biosynthesis